MADPFFFNLLIRLQIVNLGQELDILRERMKKAGLIEEAKIVYPKGKNLSPPLQDIDEIEATAAAAMRGEIMEDPSVIEDMPDGVDKEVMKQFAKEQAERQENAQADEGNAKSKGKIVEGNGKRSIHKGEEGITSHDKAAVQEIADQQESLEEEDGLEEDLEDDEGTA